MLISLTTCSESEAIAYLAQWREIPHIAILRTVCHNGQGMPQYEYTWWIAPDANLYSTALLNILTMDHVFSAVIATDGPAGKFIHLLNFDGCLTSITQTLMIN